MRPLTAASAATLLLLTGCAASVSDKAVAIGMTEERTRVEQVAVDVAEELRGAGVEVPDEATARYRSCREDPGPGVDLTVAFTPVGAGSTADQAVLVREALEDAGWEAGPADGGPRDRGSLSRGDVVLRLTASAARCVVLGVTGECVEAEQDRLDELLDGATAVDLG